MNEMHAQFRRQGLVRPQHGRVLAGVCAGIGRRFGIDPWPARLLFLLAMIVLHAALIPIYVILWILMPAEETAAEGFAPSPPAPAR